MMIALQLPKADRIVEQYRLSGQSIERPASPPTFNRIAYAAAHVVSDPLRDLDPWGRPAIDWDATIAFRHHPWSLGFKIAEAMDTAQRGMGLDWAGAQELIRRSLGAARSTPGADLACGAGTDHLAAIDATSLDDVIKAYETQIEFVEKHGGRAIVMASRALARLARSPGDYAKVYGRILSQAKDKVVLHWLGDMFDPQLAGYWGGEGFEGALDSVLSIIGENAGKVEGIKISLLDNAKEVQLRNRLPEGVACFTGDDFNYAELIAGDGTRYSHALLGIFDAVAPSASKALAALAVGDVAAFRSVIEPTVPLSRKIFEAPTQYYKAGVVFIAWLNGHQSHFSMPAGLQSARGLLHYADVFRLADQANVLDKPELAVRRMKVLTELYGVA
ncbi:dihydrodipicolinate synthase family protein [Rhizobium sp. 2YAF20]|uniref:dihydrodipicolinate synthase family protein n=1 Tax=Rhizobium sp. 2YAF20 TaxID=3233027 RepID=UPI003F98ABDB